MHIEFRIERASLPIEKSRELSSLEYDIYACTLAMVETGTSISFD
jgi:hypothetical protein